MADSVSLGQLVVHQHYDMGSIALDESFTVLDLKAFVWLP